MLAREHRLTRQDHANAVSNYDWNYNDKRILRISENPFVRHNDSDDRAEDNASLSVNNLDA